MTSVCVLTSAHTPFDTRIFHKQAKTLANAGYDVTIIGPYDHDEQRDGIQVRAVNPEDSHRRRVLNLFDTFQLASSLEADFYHFHDPGLLPVGALLSLTTDANVVYDAHEDYEHAFQSYDFPPDWLNPLFGKTFPTIESTLARRCDAIITADEPTAEKFRERGHDRVVAIHNYPITDSIEITPKTEERSHQYVLMYVGNLQIRRGLFQMIDLTAGLRAAGLDVGLWLIGPASDDIDRAITERLHAADLTDHVRRYGYVDYDRIFSYLAAGDAGLVLLDPDESDFQTNIPTKLFEYMVAGIPVISSDLPTVRRYLPDDCGIVVDYHDTQEQVDSVANLLNSGERRKQMGAKSESLVREKYSWEHEAEKLLELYGRLAE